MFKGILKFFHEARVELAKVTWPTRQAAINLTLIVVAISLLIMIYVAVADYGITAGIKALTILAEKNTPTASTSVGDVTATPITQ
jgi:preprotein translocase SecE subunit